jgi:antitoxin ParD1/3/4
MPTRNISLTEELDAAIKARVSSGRYENASEVVRAALRALDAGEERHAAHLAALRAGWEAGEEEHRQGRSIAGTAAEHMTRVDALLAQRRAR